ncbi:MAG TPA: ectonucleotide pyrophosphatase/phosphodiesterase [Opitutaceae bacterium]|nr:ectonucleotide pyrophosphatase/phosphodiesterase [Opitutaceae bacterium]
MKKCVAWFRLLACGLAGWTEAALAAAPPVRPLPAVQRVLIISVDGLRPDCLLLADAPVLHGLIKNGAYTMWARTVAEAITLPAHTSMLTGVTSRKHGVEWNRDLPLFTPVYPQVPTIFEMAARAGYRTALVAGKAKFDTLNKPGTVTYATILSGDRGTDAGVAAAAVAVIEQHQPDLLFIHFPGVDTVGHAKGWGSPEQLAAVAALDGHIQDVLAALERAGCRAHTVVIVTADHGGAALTHGPDDPRSRHIPWIAAGPGVRPGFDLTRVKGLQVNTEDTCATACWLLGLPPPDYFDGRALTEAFESGRQDGTKG